MCIEHIFRGWSLVVGKRGSQQGSSGDEKGPCFQRTQLGWKPLPSFIGFLAQLLLLGAGTVSVVAKDLLGAWGCVVACKEIHTSVGPVHSRLRPNRTADVHKKKENE